MKTLGNNRNKEIEKYNYSKNNGSYSNGYTSTLKECLVSYFI